MFISLMGEEIKFFHPDHWNQNKGDHEQYG